MTRRGACWRSVRGRAPSRQRCGGRCSIATGAVGSPAAACGSGRAITSATGPRAARRRSRTWPCCAGATTARCTRRASGWNAGRTANSSSGVPAAGRFRTCRRPPTSTPIPRSRSGPGTRRRASWSTRTRPRRDGWATAWTWATRWMSSIPWRGATDGDGEGRVMAKKSKVPAGKRVEAHRHDEAKRRNIPTAEYQSVIQKEAEQPLRVAYERRNRDLDPQLVWRGKDEQDWSDLVVHAPPLYIQEKVHPKVLIDDLLRQTREHRYEAGEETLDLFADFNGIPARRGQDRVLPTRPELVESNDPGRLAPGDGEPGRARGVATE